jgi:hypothetical protein
MRPLLLPNRHLVTLDIEQDGSSASRACVNGKNIALILVQALSLSYSVLGVWPVHDYDKVLFQHSEQLKSWPFRLTFLEDKQEDEVPP